MKMAFIAVALIVVCFFAIASSGLPIAINPEMTRCIDYKNHVVAPELCAARSQMVVVHGSLNPEPLYRPYYGGFGSGDPGSFAWGGSDRPLGGHLYANAGSPLAPPASLDTTSQPYTIAPSR